MPRQRGGRPFWYPAILSEMEQLAHRVGVLAQGKIVEEFSPSLMRKQYGENFENYVIDIMRRKQI